MSGVTAYFDFIYTDDNNVQSTDADIQRFNKMKGEKIDDVHIVLGFFCFRGDKIHGHISVSCNVEKCGDVIKTFGNIFTPIIHTFKRVTLWFSDADKISIKMNSGDKKAVRTVFYSINNIQTLSRDEERYIYSLEFYLSDLNREHHIYTF
jgi:hypothetical protein